MSHHAEIRASLLKETTNTTFKKHSSVKVSEVMEPKVVIERRSYTGSEWGIYRVKGTIKGDWDKAVGMVESMQKDVKIGKLLWPVKSVKVLEQEEGGVVQYRVDDLPWPLSNREVVIHASAGYTDDKTYIFATKSIAGKSRINKDNVFAEVFINGIILQKLEDDKMMIWSIGGMDPKGNIPEMLVNNLVSDIALALGKFQKQLLKK